MAKLPIREYMGQGFLRYKTALFRFFWSCVSVALVILATVCVIGNKYINGYYPSVSLDRFWGLTVFFMSCGMVLNLAITGEALFVYFRF